MENTYSTALAFQLYINLDQDLMKCLITIYIVDSKDPLGTRFSDFLYVCFLIRAEMAICTTVQEIQILSTFRTLKIK